MDETISVDIPERKVLGFTVLSCMAYREIGDRTVLSIHNPFDRDSWHFDYTNDKELWQIGVGPIVLCYDKRPF